MTARSESTETQRKDGKMLAFPVAASEKIYKGSTVLLASGYAQTNDGTDNTLSVGDQFAGICVETIDNTGSAGDEDVRVERDGVHTLPFSDTLAQSDVGSPVYINNDTDDSVVSITSDTSGNPQVQIGVLVEKTGTNEGRVDITGFVNSLAANVA